MPDDAVEIRDGATVINYQGKLGLNSLSQLMINDATTAWKDPTSNDYYTYVINAN